MLTRRPSLTKLTSNNGGGADEEAIKGEARAATGAVCPSGPREASQHGSSPGQGKGNSSSETFVMTRHSVRPSHCGVNQSEKMDWGTEGASNYLPRFRGETAVSPNTGVSTEKLSHENVY